MPICRSSGACEMWESEFYKHPAPLALRRDNVDSDDLLFAQSSVRLIRPGDCAKNRGSAMPEKE
jgi:hypothetical protein